MGSTEKAFCNSCMNETVHTVVHRDNKSEEDSGAGISWGEASVLLKCMGCETVTLKQTPWMSECDDPAVHYYPPRKKRPVPHWIDELPREYWLLCKELYSAYDADCRALVLMGIRALIDRYIFHNIGDMNFEAGLKRLLEEKMISENQKKSIEIVVEAGHAAAHRAYRPEIQNLNSALEVVEHLLFQVLPEDAMQKLKMATPPRDKRKVKDGK